MRSLRAGGEGCGFFMPRMDPFDITALAQGIGDAVEAVAHHVVDASDAGGMENFSDEICDALRHLPPVTTAQA